MTASALVTILGLTVSNYAWQLLTGERHWLVAWERSFFQFWALLAFLVSQRLAEMVVEYVRKG